VRQWPHSAALFGLHTVAQKLEQENQSILALLPFESITTSGKLTVFTDVSAMRGLLDQRVSSERAPWAQILCFAVNLTLNRLLFSYPFLSNDADHTYKALERCSAFAFTPLAERRLAFLAAEALLM